MTVKMIFKFLIKLFFVPFFLLIFTNAQGEIGRSSGASTNESSKDTKGSGSASSIERAKIDLVSINKKCLKEVDRGNCLLGSTVGATYVRSPQRLKQLQDISDFDALKKNAIKFCAIGGKDDSFITEKAKNSKARESINPAFLSACLAMVDEEIKKILIEYKSP